jgi:hypothetical protein
MPQTMQVRGALGRHKLTVLIEIGSTLNFLSSRVAARLGFETHPNQIVVGHGGKREHMSCMNLCAGMLLWIQGD